MSVALNVLLSQQLRASRTAPVSSLEVGRLVPPFSGVSLDGRPLTISYDAGLPTVLYYFREGCGWCERNWANVNALVAQTRGRFRVVGLTASPTVPAYVKNAARSMTVVTNVDAETLAAYEFYGTPNTVVVSPGGYVRKSWMGAYANDKSDQVAEFFAVTLPGLSPKPRLR